MYKIVRRLTKILLLQSSNYINLSQILSMETITFILLTQNMNELITLLVMVIITPKIMSCHLGPAKTSISTDNELFHTLLSIRAR